MGNKYFEFKQFKVMQQNAGMKVSTDACIQGAYYANFLNRQENKPKTFLDIGTGTGLLTLMLAQQFHAAKFTAIDIDAASIQDAKDNFQNSPWSSNIHCLLSDMKDYHPSQAIEAIICNPPFFSNHLLTERSKERLLARHDITLSKQQLSSFLHQYLCKDNGTACILYPTSEWQEWMEMAHKISLYPIEIITIRPNLNKAPNRIVGIFSFIRPQEVKESEFIIYDNLQNYTLQMQNLLQPYYLKF